MQACTLILSPISLSSNCRWLRKSRSWRRRRLCGARGGRIATKLSWKWLRRWENNSAVGFYYSWWLHHMKKCSVSLAFSVGIHPSLLNSPLNGPVMRSLVFLYCSLLNKHLTGHFWHILQTTFSNAFYWIRVILFFIQILLKFVPSGPMTISQHWFR